VWAIGLLLFLAVLGILGRMIDPGNPEATREANKAYTGCKALIETRMFPGRTMKDCDDLYNEVLREHQPAK
jgi:hypothetical protein